MDLCRPFLHPWKYLSLKYDVGVNSEPFRVAGIVVVFDANTLCAVERGEVLFHDLVPVVNSRHHGFRYEVAG